MNKIKTVAFIIVGILLFLAVTVAYVGPNRVGKPPTLPPPVKLEKPVVSLTLDFSPTDIATISTTAKTPYEALTLVAEAKGMPIRAKQYDFGVFVEAIRDVANTKDQAWIYTINGKEAQVAADKYTLSNGDQIEWKYEEVKKE